MLRLALATLLLTACGSSASREPAEPAPVASPSDAGVDTDGSYSNEVVKDLAGDFVEEIDED